ncbi:nidogen-2-like, partial [Megalops cyprinoides]|uniref:nidogen-2-like n=1 Tax=Megalops cyprinoides TaxID=118141 RepID=UPI0018653CC3
EDRHPLPPLHGETADYLDFGPRGEGIPGGTEETCARFHQRCSQDGYCTDFPSGFCCHCRSGYYGNGHQCLPEGVPQRVSGKVQGVVSVGNSLVELGGVDLHAYMVVGDGRAFTTLSQIPELAGRALMPLTPIAGLFGWLFAMETLDHQNGFSITGAEFTCHTDVTFSPGNQHVSIVQQAEGLDYHNYLSVDTRIHGDVPFIAPGATVQIEPYRETYQYQQSVVTASSVREYTVVSADGGKETFSFLLHWNISYRNCPHGPRASPDTQQLGVERVAILYEEEEHSLRYASANVIGPVGEDPSKPVLVNPCSDGTHDCHTAALCLPGEGTEFQCQCAVGYWGDGQSCHDVDECTEGLSMCGPLSQCVNVPGGHHCLCLGGYQLGPDGQTCIDIDECLSQLCHAHASCTNSPGSFQCRCRHGYEGDGFLCLPLSVHPQRTLTQCEQHRDALLGGLGAWRGGPMVGGGFVPQCDEDGGYRPLQCHATTGQCWCVDSRGQERAGTRTLPAMPHPNCDQPPPPLPRLETACERWRTSLLEHYGGQPDPRDYLPQCDALGQFEPVQCYGESTYCWCVDRDGREVVGTRSHDAVRPACIPTVAPPTLLLQPHPDVTPPLSGPTLLYAQGQQIGVLPINGPHLDKEGASVLLTLQGSIVVGIDYDCQEQKIYWTDLATRTISRARLEPWADSETVINSGLTSPEGLAVDAHHRALFWVDSGTDRIETSGLDGSGRRILFDEDLVNPRAIVVDPPSGMLYWTDWNRDAPKIESSTVEGHDRKVVVHDRIGLPNALTFDPSTKYLCWADAGTKRLECVYPDGTGRREIQSDLSYPFSMVRYDSHFYFSDWRREAVLVLSEDGRQVTDEYLPDQRSQVYGVTITSPFCPSGKYVTITYHESSEYG